jgi:hypothetical protein
MSARIIFKTNYNEDKDLADITLINKFESDRYPHISPPKTLDEFKYYIHELYDTTDNYDLKMGLEIITTLICHEKKEVVASSLGRLYLVIQDECIRKLIVKELKEMRCCHDVSLKASAEESLDMIVGDLNKYEIFEKCFNTFNYLTNNLEDYLFHKSHLLSANKYSIKKFNSKFTLIFKGSKFLYSWNDMIYRILKLLIELDRGHDIIQINESEVDDYYLNPHEPEIIPYSELEKLDVTEETYLKSIINLYALTFRENGHLNHLKSLLNDDNYKIRNMAINGLVYALNNLTYCYYDKPHGNLMSRTLGDIKQPFKHILHLDHRQNSK